MISVSFFPNFILNHSTETTRLHPAVSKVIRKSMKPFRLPTFDKQFHKGTIVVVPSQAIHMDPELFPSPKTFNPDRFLQKNIDARTRFSFLPFGNDSEFVKMLSKLTIVILLKNFKFEVCKDTENPVEMSPGGIFRTPEKGIFLRVSRKCCEKEG